MARNGGKKLKEEKENKLYEQIKKIVVKELDNKMSRSCYCYDEIRDEVIVTLYYMYIDFKTKHKKINKSYLYRAALHRILDLIRTKWKCLNRMENKSDSYWKRIINEKMGE